jgi:mannan endo-1,4-beta-mannosidase
MKRTAIIVVVLLTSALALGETKPVSGAPVNPHASPEARALLNYLYSISGKYTLTGQHNYPNMIARYTDRAYDLTGKYPALYGQDFGFSGGEDKDSVDARPALIEEVERQYRNGAVIALTWHSVRPSSDEPVTFRDNVQSHLTDFEWSELLTPGTDLNKRWCAHVDVIAGFLKQLRDAHVPVLFRPYHEMNGNWFWWGGRTGKNGSSALYRQLFDRFVNYHHLDNLVWVWNANIPGGNAAPIADYFPGLEYADVLTIDNYQEFKQEYYEQMLALAGTKPIALGEVGALPTLNVFKAQPRWTYFMIWSDFIDFATPVEQLQAVFNAPTMLVRDSPQLGQPMAAIRGASGESSPELVTPKASKEAKALLMKLYSVSGKTVLSGQLLPASIAGGSDAQVFEITAKYPAVYGRELAGSDAARKAILDEAKAQSRQQAIISFTWRPIAPTQDQATGSTSTQ